MRRIRLRNPTTMPDQAFIRCRNLTKTYHKGRLTVTPLEDLVGGVRPEVLERATPMLRQLMSLENPYPKLFDEAAAGTLIGRDSEPAGS